MDQGDKYNRKEILKCMIKITTENKKHPSGSMEA
jgi:hypothetical protein